MKLYKLLISLLLIPMVSYSEYVFVTLSGNDSQKIAFYVEKDSIIKQGDIRKFWFKTDHITEEGSFKSFEEVNCIDKSRTILQLITYSEWNFKGDMHRVKIDDPKETITYIPPEAGYFEVIKFVCR